VCILLIDDDFDDRELFREAVTAIDPGLRCVTSNGGEDAMKELRSGEIPKPNVIFLDLGMPKQNGFECLLNLKTDRQLRGIPVIIYTCSNFERDVRLTLELGASNFITKPLIFKKICVAIGFFLRLHNIVK
jgi:CheY-like chemotaxis protein